MKVSNNTSIVCSARCLYLTILILFLATNISFAQEDEKEFFRKVQENSQRTYDLLNTVSFKAHSKTYFYFGYSPLGVKMIPFLEEYYLEGVWQKPDSLRLNITALRKVMPDTSDRDYNRLTRGLPPPNPFHFTYDPSVFNINEDESGNEREDNDDDMDYVRPLYPFSLNADSLYDYEIVSEITTFNTNIVEVKVTPKYPSVPGVIGIFQIDRDKAIVIGFDYIFNKAAGFVRTNVKANRKRISFSIDFDQNHRVKTKKALYYSSYWLPVTIEEELDVSILGIKAKGHRILEFESYEVNPPESPAEEVIDKAIVYNRVKALEDSLFTPSPYPNKLTRLEEEKLIRRIENTFSSRDLFRELIESESISREVMLMGLEQKGERYLRMAKNLSGSIQYNRVEGVHAGYSTTIPVERFGSMALSLDGGYGFEDNRWKGKTSFLFYVDGKKKLFVEGNLYSTLGFEEKRTHISTGLNTFSGLVLKRDYRDYYYKKGGNFGIGYRFTDNLAFKITGVSHSEENAVRGAKFSVFNNKDSFRINPGIREGELRGLRAELLYRTYNYNGSLELDYTDRNVLHSDFSYTRLFGTFGWSNRPTFHTTFSANLSVGVSNGRLTPQKWFDFGGKLPLRYSGELRGVGYKYFTGDRMAAGTLEYSINGDVLYNAGLKRGLLKASKFTIWTGFGWSELSEKNRQYAAGISTPSVTASNGYHEFGLGIGDKLNIFRFDFIRNSISKNSLLFSFNILR